MGPTICVKIVKLTRQSRAFASAAAVGHCISGATVVRMYEPVVACPRLNIPPIPLAIADEVIE